MPSLHIVFSPHFDFEFVHKQFTVACGSDCMVVMPSVGNVWILKDTQEPVFWNKPQTRQMERVVFPHSKLGRIKRLCVRVRVYVCVLLYLCVCVSVSVYVCEYERGCVCMSVFVCVCVGVCAGVYMCVCETASTPTCTGTGLSSLLPRPNWPCWNIQPVHGTWCLCGQQTEVCEKRDAYESICRYICKLKDRIRTKNFSFSWLILAHVRPNVNIPTHARTHALLLHTLAHTYTQLHAHTHKYTHTHTNTPQHPHADTLTPTHTQTHKYTHTRAHSNS